MPRQTTLSYEEVIDQLDSKHSTFSRCLLVNELGEMAFAGDERAKTTLLEILGQEENDMKKIYALFCSLGRLFEESKDREVQVALAEFIHNERNERVCKELLGIEQSSYYIQLLAA